jgi:hypothetical protein
VQLMRPVAFVAPGVTQSMMPWRPSLGVPLAPVAPAGNIVYVLGRPPAAAAGAAAAVPLHGVLPQPGMLQQQQQQQQYATFQPYQPHMHG